MLIKDFLELLMPFHPCITGMYWNYLWFKKHPKGTVAEFLKYANESANDGKGCVITYKEMRKAGFAEYYQKLNGGIPMPKDDFEYAAFTWSVGEYQAVRRANLRWLYHKFVYESLIIKFNGRLIHEMLDNLLKKQVNDYSLPPQVVYKVLQFLFRDVTYCIYNTDTKTIEKLYPYYPLHVLAELYANKKFENKLYIWKNGRRYNCKQLLTKEMVRACK